MPQRRRRACNAGACVGRTTLQLHHAYCVVRANNPPSDPLTRQSGVGQAVSGDDYRAAEPDTLRRSAEDLINVWNSDRAEDIYRIVAGHLGVPLVEVRSGGWLLRGMGMCSGASHKPASRSPQEETAANTCARIVYFTLPRAFQMAYAELLWLDRLGMYIRSEVAGGQHQVVRVPFYRPVLDERDARSVITMAAQLAWESERSYVPPLPAIFQGEARHQ